MGILVTRAFLDEVVNGVAFTGNPLESGGSSIRGGGSAGRGECCDSPEPGTSVERRSARDRRAAKPARHPAKQQLVVGSSRRACPLRRRSCGSSGAFMCSRRERSFRWSYEWVQSCRTMSFSTSSSRSSRTGSLAVKQVRPFLASAPERETAGIRGRDSGRNHGVRRVLDRKNRSEARERSTRPRVPCG